MEGVTLLDVAGRTKELQNKNDSILVIAELVTHVQRDAPPQFSSFLLGTADIRHRRMDAVYSPTMAGLPRHRLPNQFGDGHIYQFSAGLIVFLVHGRGIFCL